MVTICVGRQRKKLLQALKGVLDGRDFNRLAKFVPYSMIKDFGMEPNEEYDNEEKWNSTESSQAVAWYVVFSSGLTGTGNKHIGDMVRTVIDF